MPTTRNLAILIFEDVQSGRKSPGRTEADKVATVRRHVPVTVGGADQPRRIGERAATHCTALLVIDATSIFLFFFSPLTLTSWITLVSLLTPSIHIPLHVK